MHSQPFVPARIGALDPRLVEAASILAIGNDENLLATRASVLRRSGYAVRITTPMRARQLQGCELFRLVVFGHTLSDQETAELVTHFRSVSPRSRLLLICLKPRPLMLEQLFDAIVESRQGPAALVRKASELLR